MQNVNGGNKPYYQLYKDLLGEVLSNPQQSLKHLDLVAKEELYKSDEAYALIINTCYALYYEIMGDYIIAIEYVDAAITTAKAINYWEILVYNYNTKGNIYTWITMYDKALEVFLEIIRIEREHHLVQMTSSAYANIALIYDFLGSDEAIKYTKLAYDTAEQYKDKLDRYEQKQAHHLSAYLEQLIKKGKPERAKRWFDKLDALASKSDNVFTKVNSEQCWIKYYFYTQDIESATKHYDSVLALFDKINYGVDKFRTKVNYVKECRKAGVDASYYIDIIKSLEPEMIEKQPQYMMSALTILLEHYRNVKDEKNFGEAYDLYIKCAEINRNNINQHRLDSLNIIFKSNKMNEENTIIKQQNARLSALTRELERSQNQLSLIMEIGEKITSSRDLNEIFDLIYSDLKSKVSVTVFALFIKKENANQLEAVAFFENDQKIDNIVVSLEDKNSMVTNCYWTGKSFFTKDLHKESRVKGHKISYSSSQEIHSVIYLPVKYKDDVIGVFTLQHAKINAFSKAEIEFIEMLEPYLAAAISNAIYADRLHRQSTHDELTNLYNRREFDHLYTKLLEKAYDKNLPISVYMMDIDRFKIYNDTYGHIAGDEALIKVSHAIDVLFDDDNYVFARFGGEEFIAVTVGLDYEASKDKAETIKREVLKLSIENKNTPLGIVTLSIGLATVSSGAPRLKSQLVLEADEQLYIAKSNGRNKVAKKLLTL